MRERPWYTQAVEAGELIFTGVEPDTFTDILGLVCAAPVYHEGELVAVVGADIFLTAIRDYIADTATEGGFLCVINESGQVLFSPQKTGVFTAQLSDSASDLRECENAALADFIAQSLKEQTALTLLEIDGREYYLTGTPMETLGWSVVSVVDKEITNQPSQTILARHEAISSEATSTFEAGARQSAKTILVMTLAIVTLAIAGALFVAGRVVKPLERTTRRINALSGSDQAFEMEDSYRTDDEIEILAESFAALSKRTQEYIA